MTERTIYITPEDYATAEKNGIAKDRVYSRVNYGLWSIERAITEPHRGNTVKRMYEELLSKKPEDAIYVGYESFRKRIQRGILPKVAIIGITRKLSNKLFEIADKNGISKGTVSQRVYQYKWDIERAITEPVHTEHRRKTGRVK